MKQVNPVNLDLDAAPPALLAGLFDPDESGAGLLSEEELEEFLRHYLTGSMLRDLTAVAAPQDLAAGDGGDGGLPSGGGGPATLGELLAHPAPPAAWLRRVAEFAQAGRADPTPAFPPEVATALFYASMAAATVRLGERLVEIDGLALARGLSWVAGRGWVDPAVRSLCREALVGSQDAPGYASECGPGTLPGLRREIDLPPSQGLPAIGFPSRAPGTDWPGDRQRSRAHRMPAAAGWREAGTSVEGYRLLGRLGEGGMGVVWRAVQLSTRREVALKLLPPGLLGSERARRRFEREVELASRLEHPHIARVYDSGMRRGLYHYAMELVDGLPLDRHAAERGLDQRQILALMRDLCLAVEYAHRRGVIHRDLKPSNVLVTADGRAYVLDFGLACTAGQATNDPTGNAGEGLTEPGQWAGTLAFMAPEQAAGQWDRVDTRTDVWGLGATLHLLLIGRPPHDTAGPRYEVIRRIAEEDVRRPVPIGGRWEGTTGGTPRKRTDAELESLLLKALARDPERRYASAGELAKDLDNYLAGEPLTARPPAALYLLRKRLRKHRLRVALAAGAMGALLTVGAISAARIDFARRDAEQHRRAAEQSAREAAENGRRVEEGRLQVERQLAESLLAQGDALGLAGRWISARDLYDQARALLAHLAPADSDDAVDVALSDAYVHAPLPLAHLEAAPGHSLIGSAFTPDHRLALAADVQGGLTFWDAPTGRRLCTIQAHAGPIRTAFFSPDGGLAVTAGVDRTVKVWDVTGVRERGQVRQVWALPHSMSLLRAVFSSDGKYILSTETDRWYPVQNAIWEVATGHLLYVNGTPMMGEGLLSGPDGRLTCFGGFWHHFRTVELAPHWRDAVLNEFPRGDAGEVCCASMSPDGRLMATGSEDCAIKLWDARSGREVRTLGGHTGVLVCLGFLEGGRTLVSSADQTVRFWDVETGQNLRAVYLSPWQTQPLPTPGARLAAAVAADGGIDLWGLAPGQENTILAGPAGPAAPLTFSADGRLLASGSADGAVRLWDVATGRSLTELRLWDGPPGLGRNGIRDTIHNQLGAIAFSPDGQRIAAGGDDGAVRLWDVATGQVLGTWNAGQAVHALALSADGSRLAAEAEQYVMAYDLPRNSHEAGGGRASYYKSWDILMPGLELSPDGARLRATTNRGYVEEWDAAHAFLFPRKGPRLRDYGGDRVAETRLFAGAFGDSTDVHESGRGAVSIVRTSLVLWDPDTGKPRHIFSPIPSEASHVAVSSDGRRILASFPIEHTTRLWDARTGRELRAFVQDRPLTAMALSDEGRLVAVGDGTGTVTCWDLARPKCYRQFIRRVESARRVLQGDPSDGPALATLGDWYYFRREWGWALDVLERARTAGADVPALPLARCCWQAGRLEEARAQFRRALERDEAPGPYLRLCLRAIERDAPAPPAGESPGRRGTESR